MFVSIGIFWAFMWLFSWNVHWISLRQRAITHNGLRVGAVRHGPLCRFINGHCGNGISFESPVLVLGSVNYDGHKETCWNIYRYLGWWMNWHHSIEFPDQENWVITWHNDHNHYSVFETWIAVVVKICQSRTYMIKCYCGTISGALRQK